MATPKKAAAKKAAPKKAAAKKTAVTKSNEFVPVTGEDILRMHHDTVAASDEMRMHHNTVLGIVDEETEEEEED